MTGDTVSGARFEQIGPSFDSNKWLLTKTVTHTGGHLRSITLAAAVAAFALSACDKTGEGEYEVEKPVIGSETDTVETPSVETGTVKDTLTVPDVDVNTERKEVDVPEVDVETPSERE